jgi:hypothetical protein
MSKIIFTGLESSGKSLMLAMTAEKVLFRNAAWFKKSGIMRPLHFNFPVSEGFQKTASELGISIGFWEHLDDLVELRDCDIFIDEIGTYFDARLWTELDLDIRRWIQMGAKMGIEIYGTAQDFAQVDLAFRRLVSELYLIRKLIGSGRPSNTKPPIKKIWGICSINELEVQGYDEKKKEFVSAGILSWRFFRITRQACELFDTGHFIKRSKPRPLKHMVRICPDCGAKRVTHK